MCLRHLRSSVFGLPSALGLRPSGLISFTFLLLTAVLFVGCRVGPDYHRPAALGTNAMPAAFSGTTNLPDAGEWKPAQPAAHLPRGAWWQLFADADLDHIETLVTANNQELAAAVARFDQARANFNIARSDLFPQVQLGSGYDRQRTSQNAPAGGHPAGSSATFNNFTASLQAGWEVDLWGRVRREVENARSRLAASADEFEGVKLGLQADLAADYFALRALEAEYDLLVRTVETYRRSLELTLNRRKGGVASDLDVSQAETQLRSAEAELPAIRLQRTRLLDALATLCGQPATGFSLPTNSTPTAAMAAVPVFVPSELLERRPDIAAAEQRMAAANAQVGVAVGAFYPRIQINGLAGFQSIDASTWFNWPSRFWSVGPSLQLPLFTGGRNRAQLAFARSAYSETVANYRQTVLSAFQEIEDQLAAQQLLDSQLQAETAALASATRTLEIANNRYKSGLVTYLEVATAQSAALSVERSVVRLRGQKQVAAVGLIRALGGGWQAESTPQAQAARK